MKNFFTWVLLAFMLSSLHAYTITSFNPSSVFANTSPSGAAALDTAVGTNGYLIEDFEDTNLVSGAADPTLIPGLTITFSGPNDHGNPSSSLWDGSQHIDLNLNLGNVVFQYAPGAQSIGMGIGDVESDVDIRVNGQSLGLIRSLPNYNRVADGAREVYIRIDRQSGDAPINEVRFVQTAGVGDALTFDHLAVLDVSNAVPEPSSLLLLGLAGFLFKLLLGQNRKSAIRT